MHNDFTSTSVGCSSMSLPKIETRWDPDSPRPFIIDHISKTTRWARPQARERRLYRVWNKGFLLQCRHEGDIVDGSSAAAVLNVALNMAAQRCSSVHAALRCPSLSCCALSTLPRPPLEAFHVGFSFSEIDAAVMMGSRTEVVILQQRFAIRGFRLFKRCKETAVLNFSKNVSIKDIVTPSTCRPPRRMKQSSCST
jgi:hypothetical protein